MAPPRGKCEFCDGDVASTQAAAFPIEGWEKERDAGGANYIAMKKRVPNRIAHRWCFEMYEKGLGGQTSLG